MPGGDSGKVPHKVKNFFITDCNTEQFFSLFLITSMLQRKAEKHFFFGWCVVNTKVFFFAKLGPYG